MDEDVYKGPKWYFSRKEIEDISSSRRDGIDIKKETYLRKSYCTFLQDLGMKLKVPQVTIATAIVFCHRFFLRQSHAKNDRKTIATVCMFLAGKVEETPRPLKDVILVSYEIIHRRDPVTVQKIKQKEIYEQQKELILLGERVVLATLGFDLNVLHPYKPLVEAIKKFKVAQNALAQVAWNFVNDGLRTSLCLQFEPHHIAAGAIFLAAKFLKVKLPTDGEQVWWQEFDVNPRQLEDVSNQMLELYEQNRPGQSSHANEGSTSGGPNHSSVSENSVAAKITLDVGVANVRPTANATPPSRPIGGQLHAVSNRTVLQSTQIQTNDDASTDAKSGVWDQSMDSESKGWSFHEAEPISCRREDTAESLSSSKSSVGQPIEGAVINDNRKTMETREWKDGGSLSMAGSCSDRCSKTGEDTKEPHRMPDAISKIDKDKVKAALQKRRKLRNDVAKKTDIMDDDDLIERELENGIELAVESDKLKQERRQGWPNPLNRKEAENQFLEQSVIKDVGNAEEGELSSLDEHEFPPSKLSSDGQVPRRRFEEKPVASKAGQPDSTPGSRADREYFPPEPVSEKALSTKRQLEGTRQHDFPHPSRDATGSGRQDHSERDHKRPRFE